MESVWDEEGEEKTEIKQPLLGATKGSLRTIPFIIANEAFERVASFGLTPNMIMYLLDDYHPDMATGTSIIFLWSAASNLTRVIGAYLADSFFGRFPMIGFGCIFSLRM